MIELRKRLIDLTEPGALLRRSNGNLVDDTRDTAHAFDDLVHRRASRLDQLRPGPDLLHGRVNELLDLLGGLRATLRERPDLGRHDGEPSPVLAGPRRLDRCVERKDVGLECNAVDHADDIGHLVRGFGDFIHRRNHLAHDLASARGHTRS